MEVHHHPDLHHKKKKFTEYLLEFLMIFLAVTLGFFAESFRESISNHEKAVLYMHSLRTDVVKDTTQLNEEIKYAVELSTGLDSLFKCLHSKVLTDSVQLRLYYLNSKYSRLVGIIFSDEAFTQLKTDGEMRLIHGMNLKDSINYYWKGSQRLNEAAQFFNNIMNNLTNDGYKIFDRAYIQSYDRNLTGLSDMLQVKIQANAKLMTLNSLDLIEYANKIKTLSNSLEIWYLPSLKKHKEKASSLIEFLDNKFPD